jgi:NitT/TauT family transport system substrate-binding protein
MISTTEIAKNRKVLRIGHLSTLYHTAIVIMAQRRIEDISGHGVHWQLFGTGPSIIEAFRQGNLDIAYVGLPPVIIGIDRGIKVKCVAGGHIEGTVLASHKDAISSRESADLGTLLRQFSGKEIGVPGRGSIHDVILSELLDRFDLKDRIRVANFRWADEVLEAFVRGDITAVAGTPALAVAIIRYGNGKTLCPPSMLWPYNPSYGIVVSERLLKEERDIIETFLRIHEDATGLLRERPEEVSEIISGFVGIVDREFVLDTLRLSPRYCAQLTEDYIQATMDFVKAMRRLGYIDREIEPEEVFETDMIRKIHGPGDHY